MQIPRFHNAGCRMLMKLQILNYYTKATITLKESGSKPEQVQ